MSKPDVLEQRTLRRAQAHAATRAAILEAARRVAAREGARELSLRAVAAEAGFAPAGLYSYFAGKDELLIALAADDLARVARAMRDSRGPDSGGGKLAAAATAALAVLKDAETTAAAFAALGSNAPPESVRLLNGRMIAALRALSEASGTAVVSRDDQCDVVLLAATVSGLALLARSGRLEALGFTLDEVVARLDARFGNPS